MYGVDYAQVVTPELDERLNGLEELQGIIKYAMSCYEDLPQKIREDFTEFIGNLENELICVEDEIGQVERQIDDELNGVDPNWCD